MSSKDYPLLLLPPHAKPVAKYIPKTHKFILDVSRFVKDTASHHFNTRAYHKYCLRTGTGEPSFGILIVPFACYVDVCQIGVGI